MLYPFSTQKAAAGKRPWPPPLRKQSMSKVRKFCLSIATQGSARDWHAACADNQLPLVALDRPANLRSLGSVGEAYDVVLIDGAAKLEDMIAAAIKVSAAVLIPVQPSPYDVWAAADLVDIIKTRQEITDGIPKAAFVISRAIKNTKLGGEVTGALGDHGFPIFQTGTIQGV